MRRAGNAMWHVHYAAQGHYKLTTPRHVPPGVAVTWREGEFFDECRRKRIMGSLIVLDEASGPTAGSGVIIRP